MPQARGSQSQAIFYDETTYGQDPGAPDGTKIRYKSFGLKSSQEREKDDTIPDVADNREGGEDLPGNIDAAGALVVNLSAEQIDKPFKHLLGGVVIARPVKPPAVPNVTGVEFVRAETTCPTGNGTLSFTLAGTTLAWAANGDTAGAAVDVSAGGEFTLQSNTASQSITVNVTAGSLPGGNASDANVDVVAAYQKEFTPGDLPVGGTWDKDYGANIAGVGRVEKINGCRIASMAMKIPQKGPIETTFEIKGANSTLQSAVLDATPNDYGHTPFTGFHVTAKEGGAGIASLTEASLNISNNLDEDGFTIPEPGMPAGIRTSLVEGDAEASGSISALFDSATLINKAINDSASSLEFGIKRGDGYGTTGNEAVIIQLNQLKYGRNTPDIAGPGGLKVDLNYKAYRDKINGIPGVKIIVRNQVSTF